jgi:hypothetical protein
LARSCWVSCHRFFGSISVWFYYSMVALSRVRGSRASPEGVMGSAPVSVCERPIPSRGGGDADSPPWALTIC